MNKSIYVMFVTILFSCNQNDRAEFVEQQRRQNEEAIKPVIQQLVDGVAKVDSNKVFSLMALGEGFIYVDPHGVVFNAKEYKQVAADFWKDVKEELIAAGEDRYLHVDKDNVLWTHTSAMVVNFKDGNSLKIEPFSVTMLFRKREGQWKIYFIQESGLLPLNPPAPVEPAGK